MMWWMSHQRAGPEDPGKAHPPSRRIAADRGGEGAGGACYVQWFTPGTQHYWDDPGVAGESAGGIGVDRSTEGRLGCADSALQYGQVDGEHDLGAFPALGG
jgi:hypothetical protein